MSGYSIDVTCPNCGGPVACVNHRSNGLLAVTIVACPPCRREWEVTARLVPHAMIQARRRSA